MCAEEVEPWLNTQWQTEKLHILLVEDGHICLTCLQLVGTLLRIFPGIWSHIFDMSSASGYMGETYFQEFGPIFFYTSSTSGNMGAKYVQEFGPIIFDISSHDGYMAAKYVQELCPRFSA